MLLILIQKEEILISLWPKFIKSLQTSSQSEPSNHSSRHRIQCEHCIQYIHQIIIQLRLIKTWPLLQVMLLLMKYKLFFRVVSSCCSKSDCNAQTKACAEYLASYSTTQVRSCQDSSPGDNKSCQDFKSGDNRSCQNSSHRNTSRCSSAKVGICSLSYVKW